MLVVLSRMPYWVDLIWFDIFGTPMRYNQNIFDLWFLVHVCLFWKVHWDELWMMVQDLPLNQSSTDEMPLPISNVHRHAHFLCPSLLPSPCKFLPILWKLQPDFSGMYWCISIATWSRYKWMQGQVPKDRVASSETQSFWCPLQIAWGLGSPTSIHQIAWDHPQKTSKRRLFRFSAWSSNLDHI